MNSNKRRGNKYRIGPHGEIYNDKPELSPRAQELMEMMMMKDALEEALKIEEDEEDTKNEDNGTPEGTD